MYKKILIATDGKEWSKRSIDYGINQAKNSGAELHVIYVIHDGGIGGGHPIADEMIIEGLKHEGDEAIKQVIKRAEDEKLEAHGTVILGPQPSSDNPAKEIIKYAKGNSIDLIVMGSAEKDWLDRLLHGSVSEKVVRDSEIPVLVVRGIKKKIRYSVFQPYTDLY